jgi:hypothetical protein
MIVHEEKKEVMIYVIKEQIMFDENGGSRERDSMSENLEDVEDMNYEEGSYYCHSETSYHRHSDFEDKMRMKKIFYMKMSSILLIMMIQK